MYSSREVTGKSAGGASALAETGEVVIVILVVLLSFSKSLRLCVNPV